MKVKILLWQFRAIWSSRSLFLEQQSVDMQYLVHPDYNIEKLGCDWVAFQFPIAL